MFHLLVAGVYSQGLDYHRTVKCFVNNGVFNLGMKDDDRDSLDKVVNHFIKTRKEHPYTFNDAKVQADYRTKEEREGDNASFLKPINDDES